MPLPRLCSLWPAQNAALRAALYEKQIRAGNTGAAEALVSGVPRAVADAAVARAREEVAADWAGRLAVREAELRAELTAAVEATRATAVTAATSEVR